MRRKEPCPIQIQRRLSYSPIMITSKSIRPIKRSGQQTQNNQSVHILNKRTSHKTSLYLSSHNQSMNLIITSSLLKNNQLADYYDSLPAAVKREVIEEISGSIQQIILGEAKQQGNKDRLSEELSDVQLYPLDQREILRATSKRQPQPIADDINIYIGQPNTRRSNAAAIARIEFSQRKSASYRKNHKLRSMQIKVQGEIGNDEQQFSPKHHGQKVTPGFKKFMYYTNAKTFAGFTQANKISASSKINSSSTVNQGQNKNLQPPLNEQIKNQSLESRSGHRNRPNQPNLEWSNFISKHFLNIKQVNPKNASERKIKELSPEKADEIEARVSAIMQKNYRKAATAVNRGRIRKTASHAEYESYLRDIETDIYSVTADNIMTKIQQNVNWLAKRPFNGGKKQYFVFGMGEIVKQSTNQQSILKGKLDIYRDFLFKINFSNGVYVKPKEEINNPYRFFIGGGNNAALIRGIMRRRFWWQIVVPKQKQPFKSLENPTNFVWTQLQASEYMNRLPKNSKRTIQQFGNSSRNKYWKASRKKIIESAKEKRLSTKTNRSIDRDQSDTQKPVDEEDLPVFEKAPSQGQLQISKESVRQINHSQILILISSFDDAYSQGNARILMGADLLLWKAHYIKHRKIQDKKSDAIYSKRFHTMIKKRTTVLVEDSSTLRMHNHFQCNYYLGNKKALFYYMHRYYKAKKIDPFSKLPLTFHIAKGVEDPTYQKFLEEFEKMEALKRNKQLNKEKTFKNIWIVKPGEYTNQGRGITVCSCLDEIRIRLKGREKNPVNNRLRTFILQKYIQKPLLYYRRKFDIRHFMLMTCFNGQFKGYWYSQGYLRTTSTQYNVKNTKDLYTHLTNDAVQKCSPEYGRFQKGNKVGYQDFQKYMDGRVRPHSNRVSGKKEKFRKFRQSKEGVYNFFTDTLPVMKEIAKDTMRATYDSLSPNRKGQTFELFGLDYMLDENMNVYLIEVNTNPCLETSCPLLMKIISGLMENVFKICIDPFFPPPLDWQNGKRFQMGDNALEENKFELVFDENLEGAQISEMLNGTEVGNIGDVAEDQDEYQDQGNQWQQDV